MSGKASFLKCPGLLVPRDGVQLDAIPEGHIVRMGRRFESVRGLGGIPYGSWGCVIGGRRATGRDAGCGNETETGRAVEECDQRTNVHVAPLVGRWHMAWGNPPARLEREDARTRRGRLA